jgi:hypothetical protein
VRRGLIVLSLLVACAAPAAAATARDDLIRPGVGIARIEIGMAKAQVRRTSGPPLATRTRREGFRTVTEWQYGFAAYVVVFTRDRVTSVTTTLRSERTSDGFGVGTPEQRLARRYGSRLRCERLRIGPFDPKQKTEIVLDKNRDCVLTAANGVRTIFRTWVQPDDAYTVVMPDDWKRAQVLEVEIRA